MRTWYFSFNFFVNPKLLKNNGPLLKEKKDACALGIANTRNELSTAGSTKVSSFLYPSYKAQGLHAGFQKSLPDLLLVKAPYPYTRSTGAKG